MRGGVDPDALRLLPIQRSKTLVDLATGEGADYRTSADVLLPKGVSVHVDHRRGPVEARIEVSAPRWLRGVNERAASIHETRLVIETLYQQAAEWITWACRCDELSLMRIDAVRDFHDVQDPHRLLALLADVPPRRMHRVSHAATRGSGVQTVSSVTDRAQTRLYAKGYEQIAHGSQSPTTTPDLTVVRFEAQLRSRFLAEHCLARVVDLDEAAITRVALGLFLRAGHAKPVGGGALVPVLDQLVASVGSAAAATVGQWVLDQNRIPGGLGRETRRKYRELALLHGLTPGLEAVPAGPRWRLDWASGRGVEA